MTKLLLFMRHAEPGEIPPEGDQYCPISERGKIIQKSIARELSQYVQKIDTLYSSPLVRAKQTADIIAQHFSCPCLVLNALGIPFHKEEILALISMLPEKSITGFVGHGPSLTWTLNRLGISLPSGELGRSCIAGVEVDTSQGTLNFHLQPKNMNRFTGLT